MKRLYTALVVLFVILSVSFYTLFQCKSLCDTAYKQVSQIESYAKSDRFSQAAALSQQFYQDWNHSKDSMVWYIRHEPLEKITALASHLPSLASNEDLTMLSAHCQELRIRIYELYHNEIPKLKNLI